MTVGLYVQQPRRAIGLSGNFRGQYTYLSSGIFSRPGRRQVSTRAMIRSRPDPRASAQPGGSD